MQLACFVTIESVLIISFPTNFYNKKRKKNKKQNKTNVKLYATIPNLFTPKESLTSFINTVGQGLQCSTQIFNRPQIITGNWTYRNHVTSIYSIASNLILGHGSFFFHLEIFINAVSKALLDILLFASPNICAILEKHYLFTSTVIINCTRPRHDLNPIPKESH